MAPIEIKTKKGTVTMDTDEHPKPKTTLENLNKLPSVFQKDGTVTAGTASVRAIMTLYVLLTLII